MTRFKGPQLVTLVLLITHLTVVSATSQTRLFWKSASGNTDPQPRDNDNRSTLNNERASLPDRSAFFPEPTALSSRDPQKFGLVDRAYLDVFTILSDHNSCSRLFGGPHSVAALTELVRQLKPRYLERHIAIKMSGPSTMINSYATGFSFRSFEKVEINLAGSFFRSNTPNERITSISPVYPPNTRETRMLVLLHELGHMVRGSDDQWVLADDGNDENRSLDNTERVVSSCRKQIEAVSHLTAADELEKIDAVNKSRQRAELAKGLGSAQL